MMTKAMIEKIQIYGSNADEWRKAVRNLAPPDQIPSQYGGSNTTCFTVILTCLIRKFIPSVKKQVKILILIHSK